MKVVDHNKFRKFEYENEVNPNKYQLGDILYKEYTDENNYTGENQEPEIGVVIQTFDDGDVRTDMWGMCCESEVSMATLEQVDLYRPKLIQEIEIMKLNLTPKQIDAINKIIDYTIEDEREHLEETISNRKDMEVSDLTDDDLFEKYKDDTEVNDHIWFSIYELQKIIK